MQRSVAAGRDFFLLFHTGSNGKSIVNYTYVAPVRDGENWFAYVNNDPVNFVDLWGLSASDADMAGVPPQYRAILQRQKNLNKLSENTKSHLNNLDKDIRDSAADMMINLDKEGIDVEISFSLRTIEEQNKLYEQGRDENGEVVDPAKVVTNAKGGQSYHNFGLAFDVEVYDKDGNKNWDEKSSDWQKVIEEGKKQGFDAGAEWEDFKDLPHFENTKGKSLKQLREENKK